MRRLLAAALVCLPLCARARTAKPAAVSGGSGLPAYAASTAPVTVELVAERFAELDGRMNSLRAVFRQFVRLEGSETVQSVEGDVLFRKPDFLRLTHRLPEPQTVVCDGTWLWVHRPATGQVIKTKLADWRRSEPLAQGLLDFGRSAELLKRYDASISTSSAPGPDGHRVFVVALRPKPEDAKAGAADFKLELKASTRDFFPAEATLRVGASSIRSLFENVRLNPDITDETFRFTPPAGADVFQSPSPRP